MADPRFYENRGPFTLAGICAMAGLPLPPGADGAALVADLAGLEGAGPQHLSFFTGAREMQAAFARSGAGFCLAPPKAAREIVSPPPGMIVLRCASPGRAFAAIAAQFYPAPALPAWPQANPIAAGARLGRGVVLAPGVVIGEGAEIGNDVRFGANAVIGPGVAIGRACEIGSNASISHAYVGDRVLILAGARIGQPGFGFSSSAAGHLKIPQLGRVIIQDDVEIGASTTIDRGALGDTVIGEGSKIDNLVQVGHNARIGRHCIVAAQTGIAGSCQVGDFVVMGGQVGLGDHTVVGDGARIGARCATVSGQVLKGARDYGGVPAKPIREWARELYAVNRLARRRAQHDPHQDEHG